MYCRLELIDKSEYAIQFHLKKQLLFYHNVLKLRQLYNHAKYFVDIADLLYITYFNLQTYIEILFKLL